MKGKSILAHLLLFLCCCIGINKIQAQDSLPAFRVQEINGMVIIGWNNPYDDLTQLVIQRSYDSAKGFKSIMSMPDPSSVTNGYVDKAINASKQYYRLFYVQPGGRYFFTSSFKPQPPAPQITSNNKKLLEAFEQNNEVETLSTVTKRDQITSTGNKKEKLSKPSSPTTLDNILPENIFTPSTLIYSNKDGDLIIALPEAGQKKYLLKVYRENGMLIFTMKDIKETQLLVDRSNFYHSGWFTYDLHEGDKVKEKNKFFIPPID